MDDDQMDPECVLLLKMERAFRGPAYKDAQTRDWRPHMSRVLQCVRENDPLLAELERERDRLREALTGISYDPWDAADIWRHLRGKKGKP